MRERGVGGVSKVKSLGIWVLEILSEAVGTTLWFLILALTEVRHTYPPYDDVKVRELLGVSIFVLIEFALTGYLITTLVSALFLPRKRKLTYPFVAAGLYLLHSEIFFVAVGNRLSDRHNLPLQIGGACVAFGVTLVGDRLRGYRHLNAT